MEKTIKNAFTYMFKDGDWKYKLFILLILQLPSIILGSLSVLMPKMLKGVGLDLYIYMILLVVISIISGVISLGYFVKCGNNIIYCDKNSSQIDVLPKWEDNILQFLKLGSLYYVAIFLFLTVMFLFGFLGSLFSKILMPLSIIIFLVFLIILPFYLYSAAAIAALFYINYDIRVFFQIKKIKKIVFYDSKKYFKIISIIAFISILIALIQNIFMKTFIIFLLIPILQTYLFLVSTYLSAIMLPTQPEIFFVQD
jgi:hypothetical protein